MELKGAKPGHYKPRCTSCNEKFLLDIPEDESIVPIVKGLPGVGERVPSSIEDVLGIEPEPPKKVKRAAPKERRVAASVASSTSETMAPTAVSSGDSSMMATVPPELSSSDSSMAATVAPPMGITAPPSDIPDKPLKHNDRIPPSDGDLTGNLGGYQLVHKLGEGGMGAVYLARQLSLDRNVALKILSPQLASDPQFVARFTREAFAAAQLSHHNVVQIHDIGQDKNCNYFSMEFVEGENLSGATKHHGKLDPETAVGYVLQAARGLKFAHDHGMIHRDIKPDNLLLNDQGIVKVADLGLVKRAGMNETALTASPSHDGDASQTQLNISMGTPAYMPPEQAHDAAHVDQRADIYSLGCTLYTMLVGRPPFVGKTAVEVITKHEREAMIPPDVVVHEVPKFLSAIILKMTAKKPEDRYQTMAEVIKDLEDFLGVDSAGPLKPKDEHSKNLHFSVERYNDSKWAKIRKHCILGFYGVSLLGAIVAAALGHPFVASGMIGFGVLTTLIYQITIGITQRAFLFRKARQLIFGASIFDWVTYLGIGLLLVGLLVLLNQWLPWLVFGILAAIVATAFHFIVDAQVAKERQVPIDYVDRILKDMRLRGFDENAIRKFICETSGEKWEEFYEAIFGYESKLDARNAWGKNQRGEPRSKFAAWRDPIIAWIDHRIELRHEARERKYLMKIEAKALAAKGISDAIAQKQAKSSVEKFVNKAEVLKRSSKKKAMETALPSTEKKKEKEKKKTTIKVVQPDWLHNDSAKVQIEGEEHEHDERVRESYFKRRYGTPLDVLLGAHVRFALAAILLVGFALWWNQNGGQAALKEASDLRGAREDVTITAQKKDVSHAIETFKEVDFKMKGNQPLRTKWLPDRISDIVGTWNGGIAGAMLLLSLCFWGKRMGLGVILGAGIALLAYRYRIPFVEGNTMLAGIAGVIVSLLSIMFFRQKKGL
jgi:serine/threonine protein kinase